MCGARPKQGASRELLRHVRATRGQAGRRAAVGGHCARVRGGFAASPKPGLRRGAISTISLPHCRNASGPHFSPIAASQRARMRTWSLSLVIEPPNGTVCRTHAAVLDRRCQPSVSSPSRGERKASAANCAKLCEVVNVLSVEIPTNPCKAAPGLSARRAREEIPPGREEGKLKTFWARARCSR